MGLKLPVAVLVTVASTLFAGAARADEPRGVDWIRGLVELDRLARGDGERPAHASTSGYASRPAAVDDPNPQSMGNAWFGVAPTVTLVARDWASSTRLAGDRLSLVEEMRLSASTRMVVGRARLSEARFTPFFQMGVGQWRVDRNYLPLTPRTIEIAGQLGTGFELRLTRRWQVAAEAAVTSLIREGPNPGVPQTMLWSTLLAARVEF
ncbi:MAG: hypothetical protein KF782_17995 [Labilithrix sp.]|nr:hypothetical protein [Labilithrix sp.]